MTALARNIRARLLQLNMTQKQLGDLAGISQVMVHKLLSGKVANTSKAVSIAKALECSAEWLVEGEAPMQGDNVSQGPEIKGYIPLISWVQAGCWEEAIDLYALGDYEKTLPTVVSHSKSTFALRIEGDSMTAPAGTGKSFPEGMVIYIDPERRGGVTTGDYVVARLNGTTKVTFKQLSSEEGQPVLKALNPSPSYPILRDEFTIIGRVIDASWGGL